jgi:hypothetical protein
MRAFHYSIAYASIACVSMVAGCAQSNPVAAFVSLTLSRNPVPIGGPVDITLQFAIAPGVPPFTEDGRVLMRFLFDDGELMASYDHDPPTSIRNWRPGSTVKYTQRIFVPDVPYVGNVPVVVGLYSSRSNKRWRLAGRDAGGRTYHVGALTLRAPSDFLVLSEGWGGPERAAGPQTEWRWTGAEASMTIQNPRRDAMLYLRVAGRPDLFESPQQVSVVQRDRILQHFVVRSGAPTDYDLPLSAEDLGDDEEARLTLKIDKTFVPAHIPGGGDDTRVLGIRVFNAFFEPSSAR